MCDSISAEYDGKKYLLSHGRMRQLLAFQRMRLGRCWVRAPAYYKSVCHCLWHASAQIVLNSCRSPGSIGRTTAGRTLFFLMMPEPQSKSWLSWTQRPKRKGEQSPGQAVDGSSIGHRPSQLAPCPSLELRHCGFNPPMRHWAQMAQWTKYNMLCNMPNMQHHGRFKEFLEL